MMLLLRKISLQMNLLKQKLLRSTLTMMRKQLENKCMQSTMNLYILQQEPLLRMLRATLTGLTITNFKLKDKSYCDDIEQLSSDTRDLVKFNEVMEKFEMTSGAILSSIPGGECVAPPDHMLHVYHDVVDLPDPHLDGTQDVTPPSSPPPACQGNYIQYNVLNSLPWQRSPGGGKLLRWTPWYYDRRTHEYSYTMPEDFDPDGSFHSVRTMDSLASSFNGTYASDGSNLYKLEDTGPAYFLQPGWDDLEASQLQSQHLHHGLEGGQHQPQPLPPSWGELEASQLQSSSQRQHLQPGWDDLEASHPQSSQLQPYRPHHLQPGWDDYEARHLQSSQNQQFTIVDQAIVHKMFLNGQDIPDNLAHVLQPHGERWCHPDCPWLGRGLPYECGYHPDWGNIVPCSQTCPGGYCAHTQGVNGEERVQQGLFDRGKKVDHG